MFVGIRLRLRIKMGKQEGNWCLAMAETRGLKINGKQTRRGGGWRDVGLSN